MRFLLEEQSKLYLWYSERVPERKIVHEPKNTSGAASFAGRQADVVQRSRLVLGCLGRGQRTHLGGNHQTIARANPFFRRPLS